MCQAADVVVILLVELGARRMGEAEKSDPGGRHPVDKIAAKTSMVSMLSVKGSIILTNAC